MTVRQQWSVLPKEQQNQTGAVKNGMRGHFVTSKYNRGKFESKFMKISYTSSFGKMYLQNCKAVSKETPEKSVF